MAKADIYRNTCLTESYWPKDESRELSDWTIGQALREIAAEVPDRMFLVEGVADPALRRRWTYAEFLALSEQVASSLLSRFNPGERVALWAPNVVEWEMIQMGCAIAGVVLVTISPAFQSKELEYILKKAEVSGLFLVESYRGHNLLATANQVRGDLPMLREIIDISDFDAFVKAGKSVKFPDVKPMDPAMIMFTSGTTGYPKGAVLHHKAIINSTNFMSERAGLHPGGSWVNVMPMFHMGGSGFASLGSLQRHATHVMVPGWDVALFLNLVESERGTFALLVPTMLEAILNFPDRKKFNLSSLVNILSGAAKVEASLVRRIKDELGCSLSIVFGQTEANGGVSQTHLDDTEKDQAETIGQSYPQCEIKIADPVTDSVLPVGVEGQICCRGYQTMLGYYNMPAESAETLKDGWLHTGDLGSMDERGFLKITGRLKDMIIRGGENIYPAEIELHLKEHPKIEKAAVVGIPDDYWGEQLAAVVILKSNDDKPTIEELNKYCKDNLASYKRPRFWYFVNEFPMTEAGKLRKFLLRDRILSGDLNETTV